MSRRVHLAPLAVATDGSVLVNLALIEEAPTLRAVLKLARAQSGDVFVGVPLARADLDSVRRRLDDAGTEAAAALYAQRRRRGTARSRRKTTS